MRLLSTLTVAALAAAALGALAAPAAAAEPAVDISVARTLSTPTDLFEASPTAPTLLDLNPANHGTTDQAATLTIGAPAGWGIEVMDRTLIDGETCSRTPASYVCVIPVLAAGDNRSNQFTVLAPAGAAVGSVTTFPVRIDTAPGVVDENPADNATQVRFRDVGTSTVRIAVTQTASQVAVGGEVGFTVTITNAGPDATVGQTGGFHVDTATPDGFTQLAPAGPGRIFQGGDADAPNAGPSYAFEYDLAAGASAVYRVTWRAAVRGAVGHLTVATGHQPSSYLQGPVIARSGDVTVVGAAVTTAPASTPPSSSSPAPELAATGAQRVGDELVVALAALAVGAGLTLAARRRRGRHLV